MADAGVLIELVRMHEDGAMGFAEIASVVYDMCHKKVSDAKVAKILATMERGNVLVGFTALLKALQQ
jgi:hypothetical protein